MGPLVFVHGAGLSATIWQYQLKFFSDARAVDLPGHGSSDTDPLDTISDYASWLGNKIRAAGPEPVTLVGHSMGSLIALETAARNADMVAGLVLIATAAEMPVDPDLLEAAHNRDTTAAAMIIKWSLPRHSGYGRPKDWVIRMSSDFMAAAESGILATDLAACDHYRDTVAMAGRVRCPTLLILGEKDTMTRPSAAQPIATALTDARIVMVEKAGHMLPLETPDGVNEAISLFLTTD
jgi:pimeloyl-ACP methyl ester carboxylesterase